MVKILMGPQNVVWGNNGILCSMTLHQLSYKYTSNPTHPRICTYVKSIVHCALVTTPDCRGIKIMITTTDTSGYLVSTLFDNTNITFATIDVCELFVNIQIFVFGKLFYLTK